MPTLLRLLLLPALVAAAAPPFRFASTYADHMVLQRAPQPASIWGFGTPGQQVSVQVEGDATSAATATVRPDGKWRASIPPRPASAAPVTVTATQSGGGAAISLSDVLFGDVWVCSGQSNSTFIVCVWVRERERERKSEKESVCV